MSINHDRAAPDRGRLQRIVSGRPIRGTLGEAVGREADG
jgi:hypothetical protein